MPGLAMLKALWAYRNFIWSSVLREFHGKYHSHQRAAVSGGQVAHFSDMLLPDHATKAGQLGVHDTHDTIALGLEHEGSGSLLTERATVGRCQHGRIQSRMRSMPPLLALPT